MISLFTTTKDFEGEYITIQKNALCNWRSISDEIQIIIIGASNGAKEAANAIKAEYIEDVETSILGTPTIPGLFKTAEKYAHYNILCYVNADILFPDNFSDIINILSNQMGKIMAVGHRWDLKIHGLIDFDNFIERKKFWNNAKAKSHKHACTGIDYFIFKKGTLRNLPPLIIGRFGWDNWLLWKTRRMRIPLIDLSDNLFAIHQSHSYKGNNFNSALDILQSDEGKLNEKLTKGKRLNLLDTNYQIMNGKLVKKESREFINRNLGKLAIIYPEFSFPLKIYKKLYRKYLL